MCMEPIQLSTGVTFPQNVSLIDNKLVLLPWFPVFFFMFTNIDETVREDRDSVGCAAVDYH